MRASFLNIHFQGLRRALTVPLKEAMLKSQGNCFLCSYLLPILAASNLLYEVGMLFLQQ